MQPNDWLSEVAVWIGENTSGIGVSILATVIISVLTKASKLFKIVFKRLYEHISHKDKKGMEYVIVHPLKNETKRDMAINLTVFVIKNFSVLGPLLLFLIVLYMFLVFGRFSVLAGLLGVVLFLFVLCVFHRQTYNVMIIKVNTKAADVVECLLITVVLLFLNFIIEVSLRAYESEKMMYYNMVISLLIFILMLFTLESGSMEEYFIKWIEKIKWVKYVWMIIGYALFFDKLDNVGFRILYYVWIGICAFEQLMSDLVGKKSLVLYTVKCKTETYETHDNILQMKDGKVNFKKEDRDVYMIDKEEIKSIEYKIVNQKKREKKNQVKIKYIMNNGKENICDSYAYLGKDWIQFKKQGAENIEFIIIPCNQIKCIMSCNQEDYHSIIEGKDS